MKSNKSWATWTLFGTTLPETNSNFFPENGWLDQEFPFGFRSIFRAYVSCGYRAVAPVYFPRKLMPELVGWVGDDDVLCTCTHVTCYATAGVVGWGGLGMMTFFALALGKHRWKKELVSGFGKKDLCVVKHGITGRFAIACASWSQGPGHGVTC